MISTALNKWVSRIRKYGNKSNHSRWQRIVRNTCSNIEASRKEPIFNLPGEVLQRNTSSKPWRTGKSAFFEIDFLLELVNSSSTESLQGG